MDKRMEHYDGIGRTIAEECGIPPIQIGVCTRKSQW